jgi:hypothetical protein
MKVDMKNSLPTTVVDVHDQTIAAISDAALTRQLIGNEGEARQPQSIIKCNLQQSRHVPLRHDEQVDRRAGVNILNRQQDVIFVGSRARFEIGDDRAKETSRHQLTR